MSIDNRSFVRKYIMNILVSIDQFFNTLLLGDPDETMSSRFGKWLLMPHDTWKWKVAYTICRILHVLDKNHCVKSINETDGKDDLLK